jgi:acetolactate synthase regulatory subunit
MAIASVTLPPEVARLTIEADRCVELLPRVLGVLAQQSLIPAGLSFQALEDSLSLTLDLDDPEPRAASLLIGRIERIVAVRSVTLAMPDRPF